MNRKILPSQPIYDTKSGRTSSFVSSVKGSITVEAAIAVPVFFLAVVSLLYLMEMMAIHTAVRCGLQYAGKKLAEEAYVAQVLLPSRIENDVIYAIGPDRLERSIVVDGSTGIQCDGSRMSIQTGIAELEAVYQVRIPIPMFGIAPITCKESMRIKAWTGYERDEFGGSDDEMVYVTETGIVYHRDYHCSHLDLSIHMTTKEKAEKLRNESGGKYHPCEHCVDSDRGLVYITDYGDRYHASLSCSGLKRTVYAIPLSEAVGKGACSKCGY